MKTIARVLTHLSLKKSGKKPAPLPVTPIGPVMKSTIPSHSASNRIANMIMKIKMIILRKLLMSLNFSSGPKSNTTPSCAINRKKQVRFLKYSSTNFLKTITKSGRELIQSNQFLLKYQIIAATATTTIKMIIKFNSHSQVCSHTPSNANPPINVALT